MKFQIDNRAPVYVQVIEYFKEEIASGKLEMGEEVPSRRELARTLNINPNTVQRAFKEMEAMGLIYTDGNMPSKVTRDEQVIKKVREELVGEALNNFINTLKTLQIPLEDIYPLLEKNYHEQKKQSNDAQTDETGGKQS